MVGVIVGGDGGGCPLDAWMKQAGQFLADDGADHLEIVAAQHGVLRRGTRGRDTPAGAFAAAWEKRREIGAAAIYAASAEGAGSFAARCRWTKAISSLRSAAFRRPPDSSSIFSATAMLGRRDPFSISYAWARLFSPSAAAKAS